MPEEKLTNPALETPPANYRDAFTVLRRIIAALQILGGTAGIVTLFLEGFQLQAEALGMSVRIPLLPAIPFACALVAGVMMWLDRPGALVLSGAVWIPQLVAFHVPGTHFRFTTGLGVYIGKLGAEIGITLSAGGKLILLFDDGPVRVDFLVNLVAIAALGSIAVILQDRGRVAAPSITG